MSQVCALFGISRQAVYQQRAVKIRQEVSTHCIVQMVQEQRHWMPKLGGKKLYWKLSERIHALEGMSIGRDKFFEILRNEGLLVKRKKKYAFTTNSHHRFRVYKNLLRELDIDPAQSSLCLRYHLSTVARRVLLSCLGDRCVFPQDRWL